MLKSGVIDARTQWRHRRAAMRNVVEGQIAELCRELAVQAKRMRQLQEQADELRAVILEWAGGSKADSYREPSNRGGQR